MTALDPVLLDQLLDTVMLEEAEPSHAALTRWQARYPAHREALADFFATWAVQEALSGGAPQIDEGRVHDAVRAHADELLDAAASNPFDRLDRAGWARVAAALHANKVFVMMLGNRGIEASTMTAGFQRAVADALGIAIEVVEAHFAAPALLPAALLLAKKRPEPPPKVTFEAAVRSSNLTKEQEAWLLGL